MNGMMKRMMLSCNEATLLMEKKHDVGLTLMEKLKIRFHISMCDGCTNYQRQSLLIHQLLQKHIIGGQDKSVQYAVMPQLKAEILKRLNEQKNN